MPCTATSTMTTCAFGEAPAEFPTTARGGPMIVDADATIASIRATPAIRGAATAQRSPMIVDAGVTIASIRATTAIKDAITAAATTKSSTATLIRATRESTPTAGTSL